ncbi:MAG: GAF domain-containing protein [Alphaproteobacteria bacterium]|nr:GAF domain-containing protein [Alphaproteobacteria bacterium]
MAQEAGTLAQKQEETKVSLLTRIQDKQLFGVRLVVYIELFAFYFLLEVIDFTFFEGKRFWGVSPHPFWLPILIMTMQYGTNVGLLTATISAVILLLGNLPAQAMSQDLYAYIANIIVQPVLWFIVALVLGELRMRHIRERDRLEYNLKDLEEKIYTITDAYHRLHEVKLSLEHRIATHMRSVIYLYESAKAVESMDESEVYQNIGSLIKNIISPEKFSLYLQDAKNPETMTLVSQEGWQESDKFKTSFGPDDDLYQSIVLRQNVLCVANPQDHQILGNEGVLAGPLFDKEAGRVVGMLKIEQIPFLELTVTNVENFKILCDWLSVSISKIHRIQTIQSDSYLNTTRNLLSQGFMSYLVKFLGTLGKRVGFSMTMVVIAPKQTNLTSQQLISLTEAINKAVEKVLRSIDLAFDCHKKDKSFVVLLPATPIENANVVVDKLKVEFLKNQTQDIKDVDLNFAVQKLS